MAKPFLSSPYPAMSYKAAHAWEAEAKKRGVSKVARSQRGFMRAYQRAGSFAKLSDAWKKKRRGFIARHMAQAGDEDLWKNGKPSRRALALLMWAYMPPGRPKRNPANEPAWTEEQVQEYLQHTVNMGTGEPTDEFTITLKNNKKIIVQTDTIGEGPEWGGEGFIWIGYDGNRPIAAGYLEHDDELSEESGKPAWAEQMVVVSKPYRRLGLYSQVLTKIKPKLKVIYADARYTPDNEAFWKAFEPARKINPRLTPGPGGAMDLEGHNLRKGLKLKDALLAWRNLENARKDAARHSTGKTRTMHLRVAQKAKKAADGLEEILLKVKKNPDSLAMSTTQLARINVTRHGKQKALSLAKKHLELASDRYERGFYRDLVEQLGKAKRNPGRVCDLTGLPLNKDGTVTVYHHTSADAARKIKQTRRLKATAEPDVYVTTRKTTDTGYGDTAVALKVDPSRLLLDDEFPDGRLDFRLYVGRPGGSIPVQVASLPKKNPSIRYIVQVTDRRPMVRGKPMRVGWVDSSRHREYANAITAAYKHLDAGRWVRIVNPQGTVFAGVRPKGGRKLLITNPTIRPPEGLTADKAFIP